MSADPKYAHILQAVYSRPWAILPSTLALIIDLLEFRAAGGQLTSEEIEARIAAAQNGPRKNGGQAAARATTVAVIPAYGPISQRQNLMSASSGGTSVEGLAQDFRAALADPSVDAIVLEIDSPGGTIDGVPELAAEIRAARGSKPIVAHANTMAASAAYWLASQADEVIVTPSGAVGSIGIFTAHQDLSKAAEDAGVKTTLISYGKFKTEGNKWEPLSDDAKANLQDQVDQLGGMFVADVAKGRGVPVDTVRSSYGQGRIVLAKQALAAGMVDGVDTLDNTIRRVARQATAIRNAGVAVGMVAAAIAPHGTGTTDGAWDGPVNRSRLPTAEGPLRASHAWVDDAGDPDAKGSYKFIHHEVSADGKPGAANLTACSTGIGVLNGGRSGTTIPGSDRKGVHAHLARHLEDGGRDAPPLNATHDPIAALDPELPFTARLALVSAGAAELVEHATARLDMRAKQGRSLSAADRAGLLATADALRLLAATEANDEPEPDVAAPSSAWSKVAANRLALARAQYDFE